MKYWINLLAISLLLIGCGKPLPNLDGINLSDWKTDKDGCSGARQAMSESMISQKDKLLSLTETDVLQLLGRADQTELYKRNEKFYTYFFTSGPGCSKSSTGSKKMTLRFNAVGLVKEAVIEVN